MEHPAHSDDYSVLFDTWLVLQLSRRALDEALAGVGLSGDDFALYHLVAVNGRLTPTAISQWTGMRPSTVTSYVRRMTERGHVRKLPSADDGRSYFVELTRAGRAAYKRAD